METQSSHSRRRFLKALGGSAVVGSASLLGPTAALGQTTRPHDGRRAKVIEIRGSTLLVDDERDAFLATPRHFPEAWDFVVGDTIVVCTDTDGETIAAPHIVPFHTHDAVASDDGLIVDGARVDFGAPAIREKAAAELAEEFDHVHGALVTSQERGTRPRLFGIRTHTGHQHEPAPSDDEP